MLIFVGRGPPFQKIDIFTEPARGIWRKASKTGNLMMSLRFVLPLVLAVAASGQVSAQEIAGAEIPETIGDKKVTLITMGFKFPLYYTSSGAVSGDGTAVGLAKWFNPKETGRWWVKDNQLCQKFPTWYKGKTFCFTLKSSGENRLQWTRDDGFSGKAMISG